MRRRTLLQAIVSTLPVLPLTRVRLGAQLRELPPDAIASLQELGTTVLPQSLGATRIAAVIERFVAWTRGYQEGVPLAHGYGHPKLVRSGASPAPDYVAQLAGLQATAAVRGGRFGTLSLDMRRTLLDEALATAGVTQLPARPTGQHVASDLMAFYFRSSEAADVCYRAAIGRQVCRPIQITTRRPEPLTR